MPLRHRAYENGKVYRLANTEDDEFYIGCTIRSLALRFKGHRHDAKIYKERRVYKHMNKVGASKFYIELLEECPCNNKMELEHRERFWIAKLKPSLNTNCWSYFP